MHPSSQQLKQYVLGQVAEPDADTISEHLAQCAECEATLAEFDSAVDTVVSALAQRASSDPYAQESDLARALDFVRRVGREATQGAAGPRTDSAPAASPQPLGRLREYQLLEKLGEGGMGAVYKARHTRLDKVVAIKVLSRDKMNNPQAVARFEREMRAVGKLNHPHLIQAHDAGEVDGTHFLVMEYVAGSDLAALAKQHGPLPVADACELIRQAAVGLAYAHANGLVHRDIKPSNIMLAVGHVSNVPAQVKVLDLGLALLAGQDGELTASDQMMGTLDYMAPEQGGNSHRVDRRADIYSLGATLYRLLAGRAPFAAAANASLMQKLMALATQPHVPVATLRPDVPAELSAIIDRMLSKDAAGRPATCDEVAALLARYAADHHLTDLARNTPTKPVTAPPDTDHLLSSPSTGTVESAVLPSAAVTLPPSKPLPTPPSLLPIPGEAAWFRRPWTLLIALALFGFGGFALYEIIITIRDRDGKVVGEVTVPDGGSFSAKPGGTPPKQPGDQPQPAPRSRPMDVQGTDPLSPMALVVRPAALPGLKSWSIETAGARGAVNDVVFSPDGKLVAAAGLDGAIRIWDVKSQQLVRVLIGHQSEVGGLAWAEKANQLVSASRHEIIVWDPATGKRIRTITCEKEPTTRLPTLAVTKDGGTLAIGYENGGLFLVNLRDGTKSEEFPLHAHSIQWSADDKRLLIGSQGHGTTGIWIWNVEAKTTEKTLVGRYAARWSPDEKQLLYKRDDGTLSLYDLENGKERGSWGEMDDVCGVAWLPDSKGCLVISNSGTYLVEFAQAKARKLGGMGTSGAVAVHAASQRAALTSGYGGVNLLDTHNLSAAPVVLSKDRYLVPGHGLGLVNAWNSDGSTLAIGHGIEGDEPQIRLWPINNREAPREIRALGRPCYVLSWSPDQTRAFIGGFYGSDSDGVYDLKTGEQICKTVDPKTVRIAAGAAWSADGKRLALCYGSGLISIFNAKTGEMLREKQVLPDGFGAYVCDLDWNGATNTIRLTPLDGRDIFWDLTADSITNRTTDVRSRPSHSPDGRVCAAAGSKGPILLHTDSWEVLESRALPTSRVQWLADTGALVAVGYDEQHARPVLWHLDGKSLKTLKTFPGILPGEFSRDGRLLASRNGTAFHVWDTATGRPISTFVKIKIGSDLILSPDGHRLPCNLDDELRYVALPDDGSQQTFTAAEFEQRFGWKNNPTKVRISPSPTEPQSTTPKPADPHRAVAEWLISLNADFSIQNDQAGQTIREGGKMVAPLPEGPFRLNFVKLDKLAITDDDVRRFAGLSYVHQLSLNFTPVTDAGVAHLRAQRMWGLFLLDTKVTDQVFDTLVAMPTLGQVDLRKTQVTSRGWARLKEIAKLDAIDVGPQFGDDDVRFLLECPVLRSAGLSNSAVTDASMPQVAKIKDLRRVMVMYTDVTDDGLAALESVETLDLVQTQGSKVTDAGRARLRAKLPKCTVEPADQARTVAEWLLRVKANFSVDEGESSHPIQLEGKVVAPLPTGAFRFNYVSLDQCAISDGDLQRFTGLPLLNQLSLASTPVTNAGVAYLRNLRMNGLFLANTKVTDAVFDTLTVMPALGAIDLQKTAITSRGWARLKGIANLEAVKVGPQFGDDDVRFLLECPKLVTAGLSYSQITDAALPQVAKIKGLTQVMVMNTQVTDEGLAALEGVETLTLVQTQGSKVTDAGRARLRAKLPKCTVE